MDSDMGTIKEIIHGQGVFKVYRNIDLFFVVVMATQTSLIVVYIRLLSLPLLK